jgi:hypothetical protein
MWSALIARTPMSIPEDIVTRVERDFPHDSGTVLQRFVMLHREDAALFSYRILRCVVQAAGGSVSRLEPLIELARKDYRDLIVAAEYDADWKRLRDLSEPFQA